MEKKIEARSMVVSELLNTAGMTQEDLAERAGISLRAAQLYAEGKRVPPPEVAAKIARVCKDFISFDRRRANKVERQIRRLEFSAFIHNITKETTQQETARWLGVRVTTLQKWQQGVNLPDFVMTGRLLTKLQTRGWELLATMGLGEQDMRVLGSGMQRRSEKSGQ